jgi:hypothetical protein
MQNKANWASRFEPRCSIGALLLRGQTSGECGPVPPFELQPSPQCSFPKAATHNSCSIFAASWSALRTKRPHTPPTSMTGLSPRADGERDRGDGQSRPSGRVHPMAPVTFRTSASMQRRSGFRMTECVVRPSFGSGG